MILSFFQILPQTVLNSDDVVAAATRIVKEFVIPEFERKLSENSLQIKQEMEVKFAEQSLQIKQQIRKEMEEKLEQKELSVQEDGLNHVEELEKLHAERSCEELSYHGIEESGTYYIDSDGVKTGEKPFKAVCEFEDDEVSTQIFHDVSPNYELDQCSDGPGCTLIEFNYQASATQMKSLIQNSEVCYQDIKVDCILAPMQLYGQQLGWFHDVLGQQRDLSSYLCTDSCNCDQNDHDLHTDSGRIVDLQMLPIASLSYGPLNLEGNQLNVTVGPLVCKGSKDSFVTESKIIELKAKIETFEEDTGRAIGSIQDAVQDSKDDVVELKTGIDGLKSDDLEINRKIDQNKNAIEDANQKVIFSAIRNGDHVHVDAGTTITYDEANVNVGGGMDIGSGHFAVPVSGIYSFSFRALSIYAVTYTDVVVRKNNIFQFRIFENTEGTKSHQTLSTTWVMNLSQNDVISLFSQYGIYVHSIHPTFFNGYLLMKQ